MQYKNYKEEKMIALRLAPGDEVMDCLTQIAVNENLKSASLHGLGASADFVLDSGHYNEEKHEISSIVGNITKLDGEYFLHVHANMASPRGNVIGGHLKNCVIFSTCEIFIHYYDVEIGRFLPKPEERPAWVWMDPK